MNEYIGVHQVCKCAISLDRSIMRVCDAAIFNKNGGRTRSG